jgi:ubiquinone biosynthesis monooxygenase Coq7
MNRDISPLDRAIGYLDEGMRVVFGPSVASERPNPADGIQETELPGSVRDLAGRLMRVNHAGEVCAQALYQGQSLVARDVSIRESLKRSAQEENDHLAWTAQRVRELGTLPSRFNLLWYAGSFAIGAASGAAGDRWNLGFLAETETQVVEHLRRHLAQLPIEDRKSRTIIEQMAEDESRHATTAIQGGAKELPALAKIAMRLIARAMTRTSYWL